VVRGRVPEWILQKTPSAGKGNRREEKASGDERVPPFEKPRGGGGGGGDKQRHAPPKGETIGRANRPGAEGEGEFQGKKKGGSGIPRVRLSRTNAFKKGPRGNWGKKKDVQQGEANGFKKAGESQKPLGGGFRN